MFRGLLGLALYVVLLARVQGWMQQYCHHRQRTTFLKLHPDQGDELAALAQSHHLKQVNNVDYTAVEYAEDSMKRSLSGVRWCFDRLTKRRDEDGEEHSTLRP